MGLVDIAGSEPSARGNTGAHRGDEDHRAGEVVRRAGRPPGQDTPLWESAEFRLLRARYVRAAAVMTTCFLGWYLAYVVMSVFVPDVMAIRLTGRIDVGLMFGLLQIVAAFVLAWVYGWHTRRSIDPLAERIRSRAARVARAAALREPPEVPAPRRHVGGPPDGFSEGPPGAGFPYGFHASHEHRDEAR